MKWTVRAITLHLDRRPLAFSRERSATCSDQEPSRLVPCFDPAKEHTCLPHLVSEHETDTAARRKDAEYNLTAKTLLSDVKGK